MSDLLNICLACGLCCDGTLIGFVQLDGEELPALRELLDIEEEDNYGVFFQPCKNLGSDGCNIYSQRPKQCGIFKCELLNTTEKKKLSFNSAIEVIKEIKQKKLVIEKQLEIIPFKLQSKSFYFKILELKKLLREDKSDFPLSQNIQELVTNLKDLDKLVANNFGLSFY